MSHLHVHLADLQKNVGTRLSVYSHASETDKLRDLEEEQEQLNSSLLALTSHFAQVQFRLKQIVDSDGAEKEVSGCSVVPVRSSLPHFVHVMYIIYGFYYYIAYDLAWQENNAWQYKSALQAT